MIPSARPFFSAITPLTILIFVLTSCTSSRKLNYFNNLPDSVVVTLPTAVVEERIIIRGDVLDIIFNALDQEAARPFNKQTSMSPTTAGISSGRSQSASSSQGYTVYLDGNIELPVLGKIQAAGKTLSQLKGELTTKASPYLKDLVLDVHFNSFPVTILGEVRSPGTFSLPAQRTTVLEALAAAGDLPNSAKKYNVHRYRDYNGERSITTINLNDRQFLYNPELFQMKPNDVLYVQTRKGVIFKDDFGLMASIVTLVVSVVTLGFAIKK
ncbi:MAG TPA: polysaccharide biosynthesis/export family protein [Chitinophagaceae bacterium]|nr:polysaccharide biosynthesis/export family protein [Chitinophagaceae bacterium]